MIDSHIHFDEQIVSAEGLIASMDEAGISKAAIIAPLCPDIPKTAFVKFAGPVLIRLLNHPFRFIRNAIRRMYDSWALDGSNAVLGGKNFPLIVQPDNDAIMRVVTEHPDRFFGWVFVNPAGPVDPVEEAERCLQTPGMIGVKAHPYWHRYPISALEKVAAFCQERDLPILIHLGTDENGDHTLLPSKFPDLNIIYAHAGVPYQRAVCEFAATSPNVYVDLSSATYVTRAIAKTTVARAGVDKCLFGTDGPYFHHQDDRFDFGIGKKTFDSLNLSEADREKIGQNNFTALIGAE